MAPSLITNYDTMKLLFIRVPCRLSPSPCTFLTIFLLIFSQINKSYVNAFVVGPYCLDQFIGTRIVPTSRNKSGYNHRHVYALFLETTTLGRNGEVAPEQENRKGSFTNMKYDLISNIELSNIEQQLQTETLIRIAVPSSISALISYVFFPSIVVFLATAIHDAYDGSNTGYGFETLNLILTDNSNQFIQNIHNFCALLFSLLTGYTFSFLLKQQERMYYALFEEVSAAESLLEQCALVSEGRVDMYAKLLNCVGKYVRDDLKLIMFRNFSNEEVFDQGNNVLISSSLSFMNIVKNSFQRNDQEIEDLPAKLISTRPIDDPLETVLFLTSVGEPSSIYDTVKQLRQAQSKRLGAMQRKMPEINMYLLYSLGFMSWMTFPIVATGSQTVGGPGLLEVDRLQLSFGILVMGIVFGIINELKCPVIASAYNVSYSVLYQLITGLEQELITRMDKCKLKSNSGHCKLVDLSTKESKAMELTTQKSFGRRLVNRIRRILKRNS